MVFRRFNLCRLAILASSVVNYFLCSASLSTMTAVVSVPPHTVRAYTVSRDISLNYFHLLWWVIIDGLTTVISLDRLLALILGMRYRQIVTLKRTSFVVVTIWVTATAAASLYFLNPCITAWHGRIGIPMCLTLSFASYTKISHTLRRRVQVQDHVQQEQQVQVVLLVCYLPHHIVITFST